MAQDEADHQTGGEGDDEHAQRARRDANRNRNPGRGVLEAKEPEPSNDGYRLVIALQSGNNLVVVGKEFVLDP